MNANATTIDPAVCEPNERPKGKWRRYSGLIIGLLVLGVVV
jgi:hypothetical protein